MHPHRAERAVRGPRAAHKRGPRGPCGLEPACAPATAAPALTMGARRAATQTPPADAGGHTSCTSVKKAAAMAPAYGMVSSHAAQIRLSTLKSMPASE